MDIITGSTGENHVTAADDRAYHAGILGLGNYVLNTGNKLSATINSSNVVRIASGDIVLNGCHARIRYGDYEDVTINSTGSDDMKRIDLIVARYKRVGNVESVTLEVIEGTPSTNPSAPTDEYVGKSILENETISDMVLFEISIDGYAVSSVASKFSVVESMASIGSTAKKAKDTAETAKKYATNGYVLASALTVTVPAADKTATVDIPPNTATCIPVLLDQSNISDNYFVKRTSVSISGTSATITVEFQNYSGEAAVITETDKLTYKLLNFKKASDF